MKKKLLKLSLLLFLLAVTTAGAQIASEVAIYTFPTSLPDVNTTAFGTARDNQMTALAQGGALDTGSRMDGPTRIEIRTAFDSSDMSVSTLTNLWRGRFGQDAQFTNMFGQRIYCSVVFVGINGKLSLDRVAYKITSGVGLLGNNSSLSGLNYSVSRIGISAGSDGKLFTADDEIDKTSAGTKLVDAIVFIGGRVGILANNTSDIGLLDAEIGPSGEFVDFEYSFTSTTNVVKSVTRTYIYLSGGIPADYSRTTPFIGPNGVLFSVVGPTNTGPVTLYSARNVGGPYVLETTTAKEGYSVYMAFTSNPTNDQGYVKSVSGSPAPLTASTGFNSSVLPADKSSKVVSSMLIASPSSDLDQDRP